MLGRWRYLTTHWPCRVEADSRPADIRVDSVRWPCHTPPRLYTVRMLQNTWHRNNRQHNLHTCIGIIIVVIVVIIIIIVVVVVVIVIIDIITIVYLLFFLFSRSSSSSFFVAWFVIIVIALVVFALRVLFWSVFFVNNHNCFLVGSPLVKQIQDSRFRH